MNNESFKPGATGKFPNGKLRAEDEGELAFKVGSDTNKGIVFLDFGTPVVWMGMSAKDAENLARALIAHASTIWASQQPKKP